MPGRATAANGREALERRRDLGTLTWHGPAVMLFARSGFAIVAQALVAAIFALRSSPTPWRDSEPWLPVYGTLIDAGCLVLLSRLAHREGIGLLDLIAGCFRRCRSRCSRRCSTYAFEGCFRSRLRTR